MSFVRAGLPDTSENRRLYVTVDSRGPNREMTSIENGSQNHTFEGYLKDGGLSDGV